MIDYFNVMCMHITSNTYGDHPVDSPQLLQRPTGRRRCQRHAPTLLRIAAADAPAEPILAVDDTGGAKVGIHQEGVGRLLPRPQQLAGLIVGVHIVVGTKEEGDELGAGGAGRLDGGARHDKCRVGLACGVVGAGVLDVGDDEVGKICCVRFWGFFEV